MGEEPAPDPGPGARRRRGSAYIINGGDATVAKEWGIVHLTLGGSGDGVVSHHSSRDLSCTRSSQRRREGGSNKREGCHRRHGSSLIVVGPFGGGVGARKTCRIGGGSIILLPFMQS
jgi:hypothetical protein